MRFRCSAARLLSAPPPASLRSSTFCQTDKLLETRANVAKMLDRADALAEYTLLAERNALLLPRHNASRYLRCAQGCNRGSVRLCTGLMFVSIGRADRANPVPNLTRSDRCTARSHGALQLERPSPRPVSFRRRSEACGEPNAQAIQGRVHEARLPDAGECLSQSRVSPPDTAPVSSHVYDASSCSCF